MILCEECGFHYWPFSTINGCPSCAVEQGDLEVPLCRVCEKPAAPTKSRAIIETDDGFVYHEFCYEHFADGIRSQGDAPVK